MAWIAITAAITMFVAPALLGLAGWLHSRREPCPMHAPTASRLVLASALAFTLAFNAQFFIQELFLVLPKALTPGLRPTLFHNNHGWEGSHPLAEPFQGAGALATLIVGAFCGVLIGRARSAPSRLLLIWMAYCGIIMALAQVVVGALSPGSDLGRAMNYLQLPASAKSSAALLALVLMPAVAVWLLRRLLSLVPAEQSTGARARARIAWGLATLPALLAFVLIIPFRVPREAIEVAAVPAAVMLAGVPWMQAGAFRTKPALDQPAAPVHSLHYLLAATIMLLAVFQLLLRPGIRFY